MNKIVSMFLNEDNLIPTLVHPEIKKYIDKSEADRNPPVDYSKHENWKLDQKKTPLPNSDQNSDQPSDLTTLAKTGWENLKDNFKNIAQVEIGDRLRTNNEEAEKALQGKSPEVAGKIINRFVEKGILHPSVADTFRNKYAPTTSLLPPPSEDSKHEEWKLSQKKTPLPPTSSPSEPGFLDQAGKYISDTADTIGKHIMDNKVPYGIGAGLAAAGLAAAAIARRRRNKKYN